MSRNRRPSDDDSLAQIVADGAVEAATRAGTWGRRIATALAVVVAICAATRVVSCTARTVVAEWRASP